MLGEAWLQHGRYRLQVFEAELDLVIIESLGAPAELAALQFLDNQPETFNLCLRFTEAGHIRRE